jgi:hypothetical protein
MPHLKQPKNRKRCQECGLNRGPLIKFRGHWICKFCLNPDYEPTLDLDHLLCSSAGELALFGLFKYGESKAIFEQVQKNGVKSKFSRQALCGSMPKDKHGKFIVTG